MQSLKIKSNGFHKNVPRVSEKKNYAAVFMQLLKILCILVQSYYTDFWATPYSSLKFT